MPFIKIPLSSICGVRAFLISPKICDGSMGLSLITSRYSRLFISLQSVQVCRSFFRMRSCQMRVALPLPSINGWATFISTCFLTILSIPSSGIFLNERKVFMQIHRGSKCEPALRNIHTAYFASKVI